MLFPITFTRITEGERKGNGSSSLMLVLSSPQVRRSTRQGRLVTVACHCISRPLTWARPQQGGSGGRTGAEAQMPPDWPPMAQSCRLSRTKAKRKGNGRDFPRHDHLATKGSLDAWAELRSPLSMCLCMDFANGALRVRWAGFVNILSR